MQIRWFVMTAVVAMGVIAPAMAQSTPDVSNKVVLANLDRYVANLRIGQTRCEIKPQKASILAPRKYPVAIEILVGQHKRGLAQTGEHQAGDLCIQFRS